MSLEKVRVPAPNSEKVFPAVEILIDDGLLLCTIQPEDFPELYRLVETNYQYLATYSTHPLYRYDSYRSLEKSFKEPSKLHYGKPHLRFGIWEEGILIGFAELKMNDRKRLAIGYWIAEEHAGRGITTKAALALTKYGFENYDVSTILGVVDDGNHSSVRVLTNCGFKYSYDFYEDGHTQLVFELSLEDFTSVR